MLVRRHVDSLKSGSRVPYSDCKFAVSAAVGTAAVGIVPLCIGEFGSGVFFQPEHVPRFVQRDFVNVVDRVW